MRVHVILKRMEVNIQFETLGEITVLILNLMEFGAIFPIKYPL
jgi:hypothetical protein